MLRMKNQLSHFCVPNFSSYEINTCFLSCYVWGNLLFNNKLQIQDLTQESSPLSLQPHYAIIMMEGTMSHRPALISTSIAQESDCNGGKPVARRVHASCCVYNQPSCACKGANKQIKQNQNIIIEGGYYYVKIYPWFCTLQLYYNRPSPQRILATEMSREFRYQTPGSVLVNVSCSLTKLFPRS